MLAHDAAHVGRPLLTFLSDMDVMDIWLDSHPLCGGESEDKTSMAVIDSIRLRERGLLKKYKYSSKHVLFANAQYSGRGSIRWEIPCDLAAIP